MSKDSRSGGKYSGNHTTLIPAAAVICDIANQCLAVTKISPGFITSGLKSVNGKLRAKISENEGNLFLTIRDNTSHQEVWIYTDDTQVVKRSIYRAAKSKNISVSFANK